MNTDEKPSLFGSIWRFFTFWKWRKAQAINRAADNQYTGSAAGISDAFQQVADGMKTRYKKLREAVGLVQTTVEGFKARLGDLQTEENGLIQKREGAMVKFEGAKDEAEKAAHKAAFERFDKRIAEIDAEQASLEAQVKTQEEQLEGFFRDLTALQAEIQKLPAEEAQAIADFVSSKQLIELNDTMKGLQSSIDRGPISAVRERIKALKGEATVVRKLAGTDVNRQDAAYEAAGASVTSGDKLSQMLAARKAKREAASGTVTPAKQVDLTSGS